MEILNKKIVVRGKFLKIGKLYHEWYNELGNAREFITELKKSNIKVDIFTFAQHLPDILPKYNYYFEQEHYSAIPSLDYNDWYENKISRGTAKSIRKSKKKGLEVKVVDYSDDFVRGVHSIYNETPLRQGRPYANYGKDIEAVKADMMDYFSRSLFIGAYFEEELVGFIKFTYSRDYALPFGLVSKIAHRDKSPQTALVAKAVEVCSEKKIPFLIYGFWVGGSLGDFKLRIGCEKISLPRYFIPTTPFGKMSLSLKLHHGLKSLIPEVLYRKYFSIRKFLYQKLKKKA